MALYDYDNNLNTLEYERARDPMAGRLPNGMFSQWTGREYGYDPGSLDEERMRGRMNDQARAANFAKQYDRDITPLTLEQKLADPYSDMYETVRTAGPPEQVDVGEMSMGDAPMKPASTMRFPSLRRLSSAGQQAMDNTAALKRGGNTMSIGDFNERERIKNQYMQDRQGNATDERVEGYERTQADTVRLKQAGERYQLAMEHADNMMDPVTADEFRQTAWGQYLTDTGKTPTGNTGDKPKVNVAPAQGNAPAAAKQGSPTQPTNIPAGMKAVKSGNLWYIMSPEELAAERAKRKAAAGGA